MSDSKARAKLYAHIRKVTALASEETAAVKATGAMPSTTSTVPVYDEDGNVLGYVALYANADLS